jgi:hypothetical protein
MGKIACKRKGRSRTQSIAKLFSPKVLEENHPADMPITGTILIPTDANY